MAGLVGLWGSTARAVEAPVLTPQVADSPTVLEVGVDSPESGVVIRYTLDGRDPETFDPVVVAGETLTVARTAIVKARAGSGGVASAITTGDYRITGAIASGEQHGLALSVGGQVWSWGRQSNGRLGNGLDNNQNQLLPGPVLAPDGVSPLGGGADLAAGSSHSLVLAGGGEVWSFGYNAFGGLGDGTTSPAALPVTVLTGPGAPLTDAFGLAGGQYYSLAVVGTGEVLSWGYHGHGRTGLGLTSGSTSFATPVQRGDDPAHPPLDGIRQVAAGSNFALARESHASEEAAAAGRVWVWGRNANGQLGRGDTTQLDRAERMRFAGGTDFDHALSISAGELHSAVVRWEPVDPAGQGTVWCAGSRSHGRLGDGAGSVGSATSPVQVVRADNGQPLTGIRAVAVGAGHTLAVDLDGHVWAWGANTYGQLGQDDTTNRNSAVKVKSPDGTGLLENIVAVSAGGIGTHGASMALAGDGTIWVWGRNNRGQLGNGEVDLWQGVKLPVGHETNIIDEGAPSVTLTGMVVEPVEPGGMVLAASPSHSGPFGVAHIARVDFHVNGDGDLDDACDDLDTYLPGCEGDTGTLHGPALDSNGVALPDAFINAEYKGAQAMNLIVQGIPPSGADQATVRIISSNHFGFCENGLIPGELQLLVAYNDFSLTGQETSGLFEEVVVAITDQDLIIPLYCHDYGGWCEVEVSLELGGAPLGEPFTLTVPHDGNRDRLADHWQDAEISGWNDQFGASYLPDAIHRGWMKPGPGHDEADYADDEEADPDGAALINSHKTSGDGLSTLKEYRGFVVDWGHDCSGGHKRMSIALKELLVEVSEMGGIQTAIAAGTNSSASYDLQAIQSRVTDLYKDQMGICIYWVNDDVVAPVNITSQSASSSPSMPMAEFGGPNFKYGDKQLAITDPLAHSANFEFTTDANGDVLSYLSKGFQDQRQANYTGLEDFIRARFTTRDVLRVPQASGYVDYWPSSQNAEWDEKGLRLQATAIAEEGGNYIEIVSYALAHEVAHLLIPSDDGHAGGNLPSALMSESNSPINSISGISVTSDDAILIDINSRRSVK